MSDLEGFYNCHTHKYTGNGVEIVQLTWNEQVYAPYHSLGIHPQDANELKLQNCLISDFSSSAICAVGEIGLDSRYPNMELQEQLFIKQLQIAERLQKPIILHCVNAWDRCKYLHQIHAPNTWLIYHGFNKVSILDQVLNYKKAIISLGENSLNNKNLETKLALIPLNRLLVETDAGDCQIDATYRCLSSKLSLPLPTLIKQISTTATEIFKL